MYITATYKEQEYSFDGRNYILKPGQFITGRKALSADTGIKESTVQRILKYFEKTGEIEQQTYNKFRIITLCYWEKYQSSEHQDEPPANTQRTAGEQPADTINKEKKDKNIKKDKDSNLTNEVEPEPYVPAPEGIFDDLYKRKQIRDDLKANEPLHCSTHEGEGTSEAAAAIHRLTKTIGGSLAGKTPRSASHGQPLTTLQLQDLRRTNPDLFAEENKQKPYNAKARREKK